MKHVVLFSSGASSAVAAHRVLQEREATLLFTDTLFEDADNYRFMDSVMEFFSREGLNHEYIRISKEKTPFQIFEDEGILGSDRVPVCSRILKGQLTEKWLKEQEDPVTLYFGFDYKELHRAERVTERYKALGVECGFPLCEPPYLSKPSHEVVQDWGVKPPIMYEKGFAHANCGGRCVRGKLQHWRHLLRVWPERYKEMEDFEARFKGGKYTFLRDYSLKRLREDYGRQLSLFEEEDSVQNVPCLRCM